MAGVLPIAAVPAAYLLNIHIGDTLDARFICNPFLEGCVSISRAVRSGPGLHLFRAVMLPCSLLLLLNWAAVRAWLDGRGACSRQVRATIFWLGAIGALSLVLYVTWLGTEGEWYSWLRRYGITFYFGGTALAQLVLLWVLWPSRSSLGGGRLIRPVFLLMALVSIQWILGVFSAVKRLVLEDPVLLGQVENIIEWCYAMPMAMAFIVMAWMFSHSGFQSGYRFSGSKD